MTTTEMTAWLSQAINECDTQRCRAQSETYAASLHQDWETECRKLWASATLGRIIHHLQEAIEEIEVLPED